MNTCPIRNNCANYFDDNACNLCEHRPGERPTNFRPMYDWSHCEICKKKQFEADLKAAAELLSKSENF